VKTLKVPCKPGGCLHDTELSYKVCFINEAMPTSEISDHVDPERFKENLEYAKSHGLIYEVKDFLVPTALGLWYERLNDN